MAESKIRLQAHRGLSSECPENTMSAFHAAIAQGYDLIEIDPNYTKDGEIVILHDPTINRTGRFSDGSFIPEVVYISDILYKEACQYDFGIYFSLKYKDEKLPLLSDVLDLARQNHVTLKIDNKIEQFPTHISEKLYSLFNEYEENIALTTSNEETICFYADKFPNAQLHYDGIVTGQVIDRLSAFKHRLTIWLPYPSSLTDWVQIPFVTDETASLVHSFCKLGLWLINDESVYRECIRFNPDVVETNGRIKPIKNISICDLHTHSQSSHDSQCLVRKMAEAEIQKGIAALAVTDHCDILYYDKVNIPDIMRSSYCETVEAAKVLSKQIKILRGIELGEGIWNKEYTMEILKAFPYDVVLGSVHTVRFKDESVPFSTIDFSSWSQEKLKQYLNVYFLEVIEMLHTIPIDVLAHLTCPFSYINGKYNRSISTKDFRKSITEILQYLIDHAIPMEINTSKINTLYGQFMPDEWILEEYYRMGGRMVTLGSDAHIADNAANGFSKAIQMLKTIGFEYCFTFENRIPIQCSLAGYS